MRRILIDNARRKKTERHGGYYSKATSNESLIGKDKTISLDDLLALNDGVEKLEAKDRMKAELAKLRFFAGLTGDCRFVSEASDRPEISFNKVLFAGAPSCFTHQKTGIQVPVQGTSTMAY